MIGFSAGAMATLGVAGSADAATMPAFAGAMYGPMDAINVPPHAPPLFAAIALDDKVFGQMGLGLIRSWQIARHPVELHAYQRGNHGFRLGVPRTTTTDWLEMFTHWLSCNGMIAGCPTSKVR